MKFLDWLYKPEKYSTLAETSGFLPVEPNLDITYPFNKPAFELYNASIAAAPPVVAKQNQLSFKYQIEGVAVDGDPVGDETVKYLNDRQSVDQTIANITKLMTQALS